MDKDIWKAASQADTYIEECFENKCYMYRDHEAIINQWRDDKKTFKECTSITGIDFQHYSMHDESHSIAILKNIEMVLGRDRIEKLNASDLWLLLEAAYSHDVGMSVTFDGLCKIWESAEFKKFVKDALASEISDCRREAALYGKLDYLVRNRGNWEDYASDIYSFDKDEDIWEFDAEFDDILCKDTWFVICERYIMRLYTEYIRKKHHERSKEFLLRYVGNEKQKDGDESEAGNQTKEKKDKNIPDRMYIVAASVALLHGKNFDDIFAEVAVKENGFIPEHMHPQFAAAMLRLGDLLDMDSNRFNIRLIEHMGLIPLESKKHMDKHKAMVHLCYSENIIEAEARSDDFEVCKRVNDWFLWLDDEVKNLICHWNKIVPPALSGCKLNKCKLHIYYKDRLFDASQQMKFVADSDRVYKMLIGNNIYKTRLDFIREYLQNAMDASKMKLWLKIKEDQTIWNNFKKETISPYDIDKIWYEQYKIVVNANVDWKEQQLIFSIQDNGIGMERECIQGLSHIANNNWKKRSIYANEIHQMPLWLRPTGGFGIGIQSAFMITDSVEFITKSIQEQYGHKVRLEGRHKGGRVSVYEDRSVVKGTKVRLKIRLVDFFKEVLRDKNFYSEKISGNIFDKHDISKIVSGILSKYISSTAKFSLFPIEIKCDKEKPEIVGMEWNKALDDKSVILKNAKWLTDMEDDVKEMRYAVGEEKLILWLPKRNSLVIYTDYFNKKAKAVDSCYYKGVWISGEDLDAVGKCNIQIIYYQDDVSKYLTINRDKFRQDFEAKFREDIRDYKELYARMLAYNANELKKCRVSLEMALTTCIYYQLGKVSLNQQEYEIILNLIPPFVIVQKLNPSIFQNENLIQMPASELMAQDETYTKSIENTLFVTEQKKTEEVLADIKKNAYFIYNAKQEASPARISVIDFAKMCVQMKQLSKEEKLQNVESGSDASVCWDLVHDYGYIISDERICKILDGFAHVNGYIDIKEDHRYIMRIARTGDDVNASVSENNMKGFIKEELRKEIQWENGCPLALCTAHPQARDDESGLWITKIFPGIRLFSLDENRILNEYLKEKPGLKYLILPLTEQMRKKICDEIKENGEITKEKYDEIVKNEEEMRFLLEWVYVYQRNDKRLKPMQIWEEYVKLFDLFYHECFSKMNRIDSDYPLSKEFRQTGKNDMGVQNGRTGILA